MKKTQQKIIELFSTNNEIYNECIFSMFLSIRKNGKFKNEYEALDGYTAFYRALRTSKYDCVTKINNASGVLDRLKLDSDQRFIFWNSIYNFFRSYVCYDDDGNELDTEKIKQLVEIERSKAIDDRPKTKSTKDIIIESVQNELKNLPQLLADLEPAERLKIISRFLPYIVSKY